jgi:Ca-activated chloride channel homolog
MKTWGMVFAGLAVFGALISVGASGADREMKQGSDAYNNGRYADSLSHFLQARMESPDDPRVRFNLASAQYQTGRFDEAAKGFKAVVMQSKDPRLKQKAIYNLGNTFFRQGNLPAAVNFYRRAVNLNPSDLDAKQNLEFALTERKKNEEDKGQGASTKEAERRKSQNQRDPAPQSHSGRARNNNSEVDQTGPSAKQATLRPDEAERLLNSLSNDQRAFLKEQAKRLAPPVGPRAKDW